MPSATPSQKLLAEFTGTLLLLAIVVGSGIMGERLADGNDAIALLGNTLSTGAGLTVLILIFAPVSGAHFNPAVSLVFMLRRELTPPLAIAYTLAQLAGAIAGVILAHGMFDEALFQYGNTVRTGTGQLFGEATATFGLILTILACIRFHPGQVAYAVGLYITAGYWFTSSTSFANPAVTIARSFTETFAGIRLIDAPLFITGQIIGALLAFTLARSLWNIASENTNPA